MDGSVGKLNCTDLPILGDGCAERFFTVSMTFRHLATVVEMADCSSPEGLIFATGLSELRCGVARG